jgi:hypothetical protein
MRARVERDGQACRQPPRQSPRDFDWVLHGDRIEQLKAAAMGSLGKAGPGPAMSVALAHQPHFPNQPGGVQVFWGYSLFPDRVGIFVPKAMAECNGAEIRQELCGHLAAHAV